MTKEAAKTGIGPTVLVAIEQHFPENQRIIEDDLAFRILPFSMRAFVWLMRFNSVRAGWSELPRKTLPESGAE
ncbi:hypothetical protein [Methanosarcina horonobensis]|uniref:hypothetical protein n=1 Tax=Methanosarcina horonobensis TaxID=418008 RepID=UPI000B1783F4|nr:hypothetical protein [Methanosarcina horonobensis]